MNEKNKNQLATTLTIRDYFAAESLPLINRILFTWDSNEQKKEKMQEMAAMAYQFAEAMMEAREK